MIVIDTNVFLSMVVPLLSYSQLFKREELCLLINDVVNNEYTGRAHSHGYRIIEILLLLQSLRQNGELKRISKAFCDTIEVQNEVLQDDAHFIKLAVAGHSKVIVTYDEDDLLNHKEKIQREFCVTPHRPSEYDIFF